jgi:hypothetical protein
LRDSIVTGVMYDRGMKTLLIVGHAELPAALRDVVERGSTSVVETRAAELRGGRLPGDADRVVLWAAAGDLDVANLAVAYSRGASPERKDALIVISPDSAAAVPGIPPAEIFVWPRDEDRLKMAFMTGA